jgi:hypothetical protein
VGKTYGVQKGLTNRSSQPLAEVMLGFDFMKLFSEFAALAGLEQGELVTLPSLPDADDWEAFAVARDGSEPNAAERASIGSPCDEQQ